MSKQWQMQPQVSTGIDWSNPITRGLSAAIIDLNGQNVEIITQQVFPNRSTRLNKPQSFSGNVGSIGYFPAGSILARATPADSIVGNWTAFAETIPTGDTAVANYTKDLIVVSGDESNMHGFGLGTDQYDQVNNVSVTQNAATGRTVSSSYIGAGVNNYSHRVAAIYDGSNFSFYRNGGFVSSSAYTTNPTANANRRLNLARRPAYGSTTQNGIGIVFIWNRALSPQEIKSLSDNPWQIFQPLPSRIFVGPAATGNVALDPTVGSVIITGYVPTFGGSQTISGIKGSVTLTGYVATLDQDVNLSGVKGSVTLTGYLPTLDQDQAITAVKGSVTVSGYAPTLEQDVALSPTKGSVSVTGFIPDWTQTASGTLIPSRGSVTLTGYVPTLEQDITLSGVKGSVVVSGYAPAVVQEYVVNPLTGAVVLTGNQPSVTQGADTVINPATANAILSGYIPTLTQVAPTIARPSSDLTGTWSASDGGVNKYAMIDETVMDNADYIYTNSIGAKQRMTLSAVADPGTTAGQVFSYAVWSPSSNGIKVRLLNRDDDSLIAEWTHAGPLPTTPPTVPTDQSLTPTQIAAIHSYSGIDLEVEAIT